MKLSMPPEVLAQIRLAIREGNKIEAIKILRAATGLSLADAKDAIERIERDPSATLEVPSPSPAVATLPAVQAALAAGNKIEAIKRYREAMHVDLKTAKDAVEKIARETPDLPPSVQVKKGCLGLVLACALPVAAFAVWCALA